ncbi:methyl-accepting chemotaxis protein [Pseudomonas panipatensis]|uniref:Methyl-accepting chemotaxis protein n=2 Tax=Pseudomonas panipatensis TaxID=428992 RepID=A0A1G8MGY1_9PSED|nr:methyl-accepting chemotaxis protein [Pseudomonas panipatensis]SDI67201.1 methyl-accepting chemotaxis protein [Pseudomonas panipatensis]SMP77075.1 methyl-accepting chemotaxis protein [Pseudomonas panipatensis]
MFLNTSLRTQILALLGGSLLLVLLIALACFQFLSGGINAYQRLLDGPLQSAQLIDKANLAFKNQVQEWKDVLLRGQMPSDMQKYWGLFEEQERNVQDILQQLQQNSSADPELQRQVSQLREEHRQLGAAYRKGRDAFLAAGGEPRAGDAAVKGIDRNASAQMSALVNSLHQLAEQQSRSIAANAQRTVLLGTLVLLLSGALLGLLSLWLVNRNLIGPISRLIEHIAQLAQGNFGQHVDSSRRDELGRLARAANTLRDFLADTFTRLKHSTGELDSASGELNAIAAIMAEGTREQFSRTDQVATAMHEMSATAQEVARHAADAARAADDADQHAQSGERVMQSTIQTITQVSDEIASTAEVIRRLEADSGRIGKVLEVIRGIAEQTNLLALNAAIEAARAGEQGRGFAVVADEVRTLAQRTAESTAEIHQIIDTVQTGAVNAVRAIESGQSRSEQGLEQVTQAGDMLQSITHAVEAIRDMNRQIATAAEEQTSVAEDISRNLAEITSIASTNDENVQRTHRASQHLHGLSGELSDVTHRLGA